MSGPFSSASTCWVCETPPYILQLLSPVNFAYAAAFEATCSASSRVGTSTRARNSPLSTYFMPSESFCMIGRMKAAVFPVPVWAHPNMSRPASISGMARACMGEGFS